MNMKCVVIVLGVWALTGCELLPESKIKNKEGNVADNGPFCLWNMAEFAKSSQKEVQPVKSDCDIEPWLRYWANIETLAWPERKAAIEDLSESPQDTLKKVFLSQGKDTPYQNRLRAHLWLEALLPKLSADMQKLMRVALYRPSLDLLEMESALVTLSQSKTKSDKKVASQKQEIENQAEQIEQLLKIEASIIDSEQEGKP